MKPHRNKWHKMRKAAGRGVTEMSRLLGVSRQWIHRIENDTGSPSEEMQARMSQIYVGHIRAKVRVILKSSKSSSSPKGSDNV